MQALVLLLVIQIPILPIVALAPNLPQLMQHFRATPSHEFLVPMIITLPSLGIVLLAPLAGALADHYGRRRLLLLALALFTVFGLLPLGLNSLPAILCAQAGLGIAEAIIMTVGNTMLGDYFGPEARNRWLGLQSILGPFLTATIAIVAGLLGNTSWRAPFATNLIGAVAFVWMLIATWESTLPVVAPGAGSAAAVVSSPFPWRRMAPIYAVTLLTGLIFYVPAIHMGMIFNDLGAGSPALIAVLITVGNFASVGGGYYFARQHSGTAINLALLYAAYGAGLLGLALSPGYLAGMPFALLVNFGVGLALPTLIAWALRNLDGPVRGRGMGLWMSSFFAAQLLCPPLFALLIRSAHGISTATGLVGSATLLLAIVCYSLPRFPIGEPA